LKAWIKVLFERDDDGWAPNAIPSTDIGCLHANCEVPMARIKHEPNVAARELAKQFNETAFLAKTPDIFEFHDQHTAGEEFWESVLRGSFIGIFSTFFRILI